VDPRLIFLIAGLVTCLTCAGNSQKSGVSKLSSPLNSVNASSNADQSDYRAKPLSKYSSSWGPRLSSASSSVASTGNSANSRITGGVLQYEDSGKENAFAATGLRRVSNGALMAPQKRVVQENARTKSSQTPLVRGKGSSVESGQSLTEFSAVANQYHSITGLRANSHSFRTGVLTHRMAAHDRAAQRDKTEKQKPGLYPTINKPKTAFGRDNKSEKSKALFPMESKQGKFHGDEHGR
jgi:hypothetical protein